MWAILTLSYRSPIYLGLHQWHVCAAFKSLTRSTTHLTFCNARPPHPPPPVEGFLVSWWHVDMTHDILKSLRPERVYVGQKRFG
jgi:hypothetical protein